MLLDNALACNAPGLALRVANSRPVAVPQPIECGAVRTHKAQAVVDVAPGSGVVDR